MPSKKSKKEDLLRQTAEELVSKTFPSSSKINESDVQKLIHELQVHQVELEIQNEELQKAQAEIEESRSKYFDLYDFAPVGYFTFDRKGMILEANLAGSKLLNVERSLLLKRPFVRFISPESRNTFQHHLEKVFSSGTKEICAVKIIKKGGCPLYVSVESISSKDGEGHSMQCRSAIIDITTLKSVQEELQKAHDELEMRVQKRTEELASINKALEVEICERKRAEEALHRSYEKENLILESITEGFVSFDREWHYTYVNETAARILQKSREELLGRVVWETFPQADAAGFGKFRDAVVENRVIQFEEFYPAPLNHWYECNCYPSPEGLSVFFLDITERKGMENALVDAIRRAEHDQMILEAVINQMPAGVIVTDATGLHAKNNQEMDRIWKRPMLPTENIHDHGYRAFHCDGSEYRKEEWPLTRALVNGEIVLGEEMTFLRGDGSRGTLHVSSAPVRDKDGNIIAGVVIDVDVTERKRAEESLRESQNLLRTVMEGTPDPIYVKDDQSRILLANPALTKVAGKPIEEILGKTDGEYYGDACTGQTLREHDLRVMETGQSEATEETVPTPDGYRTFISIKTPYRNAEGNIIGIFGISHDITERKKVEFAFQESEAKANALIKYAPTGIYEIDYRIPKFISVNDAMCQILGYTREELLSKDPSTLLDDNGRALFESRVSRQLAGKKIEESVEFRVRKKDGSFIDAILQVSLNLVGSEPWRALVVAHDITERKRAEEALRKSEDRLKFVLETCHIGAWDMDIADHTTIRSQQHDRIYGYETMLPQWTYEMFLEHVVPEDRGRVDATYQEAVRNQSSWDFEFRIRRPDGQVRWIWATGSHKPDASGRPRRVAGIVLDITERKRAEEGLKKAHDELEKKVQERTSELSEAIKRLQIENIQRQRLEKTLRESENQVRFFASECLTAQETERKRVAGELHDSIAAALSAIKFRIDNLVEEMKQGHGSLESLQDLASMVMGTNNEVRRIMADLRPSVLDDLGIIAALNWFCREYHKTYSHISVEDQIEISEDEVPISLKTPIFRISQEAMNNIAKHSQASLVNLSLRKENDKILLTIEDNGKGFELRAVKKGMGISTMNERAELSGGSFEVESADRRGTMIRVSWQLH